MGIKTSPVDKSLSISANTVLLQDFGLRHITSVKCCPYIMLMDHVKNHYTLFGQRALLFLQTSQNYLGNTSGVLLSLRFRHVLVYYQVIFQISLFHLIIFWWLTHQKMISYPPKIIKLNLVCAS